MLKMSNNKCVKQVQILNFDAQGRHYVVTKLIFIWQKKSLLRHNNTDCSNIVVIVAELQIILQVYLIPLSTRSIVKIIETGAVQLFVCRNLLFKFPLLSGYVICLKGNFNTFSVELVVKYCYKTLFYDKSLIITIFTCGLIKLISS